MARVLFDEISEQKYPPLKGIVQREQRKVFVRYCFSSSQDSDKKSEFLQMYSALSTINLCYK
jgi:hypothetical protein